MIRTVPELIHELTELQQDVREHRLCFTEGRITGLQGDEPEDMKRLLLVAEKAVMAAALELHGAQGILMTASVRWMAREEAGQDPSQEETPQ